MLENWNHNPGNECDYCYSEPRRRVHVLNLDENAAISTERLQDADFAEAVLISPFNESVLYFAQQHAINFAAATAAQNFEIQACDSPPAWFCSVYSTEELLELKKKWLGYHARKTDGILFLLLACFNMPYARQWPGLQKIQKSQRLPLQIESLGLGGIRFGNMPCQGCRNAHFEGNAQDIVCGNDIGIEGALPWIA